MTIAMIVDDDEDIRLIFREVLQRGGFELVLASNADEAIRLLETQTPDIAFIDMNMPGRPGTDVLTHIQSTPRLSHVKTVVVTANSRTDARATKLGADLLLFKPVAIADMLQFAKQLTANS